MSDVAVTKDAKVLTGVVHRCSSAQTIKVETLSLKSHPKYRKVVKIISVVTVHDENNVAKIGDKVQIRSCRPKSKTKTWELVQVLA